MKTARLLVAAALASTLLAAPAARADFPSFLEGVFPADSSAFPGLGTCQADGASGATMTPFGWYAPPCRIDPIQHFMNNPQFMYVVAHVQTNPVFGPAAVPEPGAMLLFASGLAGLAWFGRGPRRA